jgi:phosphatidylinositol alpha-1,6-mannosyltransferase
VGRVITLAQYFAVAAGELRKRPTLVQAMTWRAALPMLLAGRGTPMVLFCHGAELIRRKGGAPAAALRRSMLRRANAVVANSRYTAGLVRDVGNRDAVLTHPPLRSLPNDVTPRATHEGPLRVLSVGRLVTNKGHARLVRAMAAVRESGVEAVLTIAGTGPDELELRLLVDELGLGDTVKLVGAVNDADLETLYRNADVFALLSTPVAGEVEGWGIVFLEAAGYALPVVAGRSGGAAEAVVDGETGIVVGDDATAVDALVELARDPARRRALGAAGRARVAQFLLPEFRAALDGVYASVANGERL